ncbi:hypothetical protein C8J57DRAFT_1240017 [Mycena rebaudengoi]|nr:hypothetical protein C8J57DRAFT_1240017 [Mycena rebaudengoi]
MADALPRRAWRHGKDAAALPGTAYPADGHATPIPGPKTGQRGRCLDRRAAEGSAPRAGDGLRAPHVCPRRGRTHESCAVLSRPPTSSTASHNEYTMRGRDDELAQRPPKGAGRDAIEERGARHQKARGARCTDAQTRNPNHQFDSASATAASANDDDGCGGRYMCRNYICAGTTSGYIHVRARGAQEHGTASHKPMPKARNRKEARA